MELAAFVCQGGILLTEDIKAIV